MPKIILSYRRDDTRWVTGLIYGRLADHYGPKQVFMDVDTILLGLDFKKQILQFLKDCDLMLAIIGPAWAGVSEGGRSRLSDKKDWVRIELEAALAREIPLVPIRIDGAALPTRRRLPRSLHPLHDRQAAILDTRLDFDIQMTRLIHAMDIVVANRSLDSAAGGVESSLTAVAHDLAQELSQITQGLTVTPVEDREFEKRVSRDSPHSRVGSQLAHQSRQERINKLGDNFTSKGASQAQAGKVDLNETRVADEETPARKGG